jgi:hypothetical protein
MRLCVFCGARVEGDSDLCVHHHAAVEPGWASTNRTMCDFIHRGIAPGRLPSSAREPLAWIAEEVGAPSFG